MIKIVAAVFAIVPIVFNETVNAQGCSDSGFCTMGALKPDQTYPKKFAIRLNSIELTQHLGHTKYGDWINSTFMDVNIGLSRRTSIQVRLPAYEIIRGKMPTQRGWGDLFVNVSHAIKVTENYRLSVSAGGKIYTSTPDRQTEEGNPMPMYQQTSYGSNDINFGAALANRNWTTALGYQRALNEVKNNYTSEAWIGSPLYNTVKVYDPSAGLKRGDDLMFRIERNFRLSRFNFYAGILNLWRLQRDKVLDESGSLVPVNGSQGLAMNFLTGGGYQFSTRMGIRLLVSVKLKDRKNNPDGLDRNFIGQFAYIVRF